MAVTKVGQRYERLARHVPNVTLSANILNSDTAIPCNDTANLPADGEYRIQIGTELIEIETNNTANNTLTAKTRGAETTSAANHSEGAEVFPVLTAEGIQWNFLQNSLSAGFSFSGSIEAVPNNRIQDENGDLLTVSDFTWVHQGTATAVDSGSGGILLTTQGEARWNHRGLYLPVPTIPYNVRAKFRFGPGYKAWDGTEGSTMSLGWRQSTTNEIGGLGIRMGQNMALWNWTSPTGAPTTIDTGQTCTFGDDALWLMIRETSTERQCYVSFDGNSWSRDDNAFWQESRTSTYTADQIGFFVSSNNGLDDQMYHIESFVIEEE